MPFPKTGVQITRPNTGDVYKNTGGSDTVVFTGLVEIEFDNIKDYNTHLASGEQAKQVVLAYLLPEWGIQTGDVMSFKRSELAANLPYNGSGSDLTVVTLEISDDSAMKVGGFRYIEAYGRIN